MDNIIQGHLETIGLGEIQAYHHLAVIPMIGNGDSGPEYLTMTEAMNSHLLTIMELTEGGHVPELKVLNQAAKPVLLLDGEELSGAKQNRVLNTTILLKEHSETVIPVSCTEQGRWSYRTEHFEESGYIMTAKLRTAKNESVARSLRSTRRYDSDQGAVWNGIQAQSVAFDVRSPTGAMRDIHEAKESDLDAYLEHFPLVSEQKGLFVMVNGEVAGLDMVSQVDAFRNIYPKLIKSYIMDAILEKPRKPKENSPEKAKAFMADIFNCEEQKYDSVGHGQDYRYEGKKIVGSALVHENAVIHMAFFMTTQAEKSGSMAGLSRRRSFRQ